MREFFRLSREAHNKVETKDEENMLAYNISFSSCNKSVCLVRSVTKMGLNMVWGEEVDDGYNALIRSSIYQKGQMLKFNRHGLSFFVLR